MERQVAGGGRSRALADVGVRRGQTTPPPPTLCAHSTHIPTPPLPPPPLQVLETSADLRTSACCPATPPPEAVRKALALVPDEVVVKYYGCGSPCPLGIHGLRWVGGC